MGRTAKPGEVGRQNSPKEQKGWVGENIRDRKKKIKRTKGTTDVKTLLSVRKERSLVGAIQRLSVENWEVSPCGEFGTVMVASLAKTKEPS